MPTNHTPEDIVKIVDKLEMDRSQLHARMDGDMDLYHLQPYGGELDANGENILEGYTKFTANDPQTTMNLALHLGSTAKRIIRVQQARAQNEQREMNNLKEIFCLGSLTAIDEDREKRLMPALLDGMFSQSLFRGRIAQRILLIKEEIPGSADVLGFPLTNTRIQVDDWDPRNTYWFVGPIGLSWACLKSWKSRQAILDEYGVDPAAGETPLSEDDYEKEYAVYDYFDDQDNTVIIENHAELKLRTPHGMGTVPVAIAIADLRPQFQASKEEGYGQYYGESLYKADRSVFNEANFQFSVLKELTSRSIKQGLQVMSRDGSLVLPEDPRVAGQEVSLSTANDEQILPIPPMEAARETDGFLGIISGMVQRGTFPSSAFGELAFQLSGFAITQLAQGLEAPLTPHIKAVRSAYKKLLDILSDAYTSGQFDAMELSGRLQNPSRSYFAQLIPPELVKEGGAIEVEITAQLPKDDTTRVTLAQMLRDPSSGAPIADDRFICQMLEFQDPEQMERAVWEQVARQGSELSIAWNSYQAMLEQGDEENAAIWWDEFQRIAMQKWLETLQLMFLGGGQTSPNTPGSGNGATPARRTTPSSQVAPPETRGIQSRPNPAASAASGAAGGAASRPTRDFDPFGG